MLMSSRPIVISRGRSFGSTSNTVRRPSGSRLVVTTPAGLWNRKEPRPLDRRDLRAVEFDPVARRHVECRRRQHLAVHPDAPRRDQLLGIAARRDADARQPLGDAFALFASTGSIATPGKRLAIAVVRKLRTPVALRPVSALKMTSAGGRLRRRAAAVSRKACLPRLPETVARRARMGPHRRCARYAQSVPADCCRCRADDRRA